MILQSWRISSTRITPRWWWVRVHESAEDLRRAAYRHTPWHGRDFWADGTLACCHPVRALIKVDDDLDAPAGPVLWPDNGLAGVIRLSAENLYTEVIYHELLHAACATYRMNVGLELNLGDGYEDMSREEDLAYIYGQLAADMDTQLKAWCRVESRQG